ncbi:MAG: gamma carbonic anhydrase family protein [Bacillota bacterium]
MTGGDALAGGAGQTRWPFGAPVVDPTVFVAPGAQLIGNVIVGADSSVWYGACLRGDENYVRVGRESNIQEGAVLHPTGEHPVEVGDRVTVGHGAILHACTVEDDCLIGMGAIVLDGARVGRGSLVGAGTLVPPGKEIPPGSVVLGVPGKVVRPAGEGDAAQIAYSAARYVELTRIYREQANSPP